ncbi:MAG TPA: hypothetical protein VH062_07000 [Polyangiaceae bacterium]|nr:hypothetical protein [Polyangiaceae bacterium]
MKHWNLRSGLVLALGLSSLVFPSPARADRTFLVGGTVLDGKAVRKGDKVVIRLESGEITVPADSVERIEKSESVVSRFDAMYAKLPKGNVKARLELADYCRDHGMRTEEHRLLLEVVDLDRDNDTARSRLGFVKSESGWVTQADSMRAKGMVEHDGQWMTPADIAELERARVAREAAAERRESEEADLAARRHQLDAQQAEVDNEASRLSSAPFGGGYYPYYSTFYPTYGRVGGCHGPNCGRNVRPARAVPSFATHHHEDTSLSVVKVPYRRH